MSQENTFFLPWFMFPVNTLFSIPWFIMTLSGHRGLPHFDTRSSVKHGTLEDLSKLSEILRGFTTNHGHFLCDWLVDVESNIILGFLNTNGVLPHLSPRFPGSGKRWWQLESPLRRSTSRSREPWASQGRTAPA